jgi:hypothetical protein
MADVVKQQEDQPWLISPEARVAVSVETHFDESLSAELKDKQRKISLKLRQDLERKLYGATESQKDQGCRAKERKKGNLSEAERYQKLLTVRKK